MKSATERATPSLNQLLKRYGEVQLATLVDQPPEGDQWVHEIKLDGYRLFGYVSGGSACLRTRNGKDWTGSFPSLVRSLEALKADDAVLDMEAVVTNADGKSNFQALQAALGEGGKASKIVAYVFDLLHLDGKDLSTLPLIQRKAELKSLLAESRQSTSFRYSKHFTGLGSELLAKACDQGLEGIVSKRADSPYTPGRQHSWLKSKCGQRQEFIILGFSKARSGERALGALYLGYRKEGALLYAGKVGTGFSMASALDLVERFEKLAIQQPTLTRSESGGMSAAEWQAVRWIKPVLICEVAFTEWTQDGRIRHPSFQGLRRDKDAGEVKKEMPVSTAKSNIRASAKKPEALNVAGIAITHPDRVISETGNITKGQVAAYYAAVAPLLLPRIVRRPISLLRCPTGIDGECFYQRNPGRGLGPDVQPFEFKHKGKKFEYLYIEDEKGLLELIQMGTIEIHPWGAAIDAVDKPNRLIFDLDPAPDVPFEALKLAAQDLRQRLQQKGLDPGLKSSGGKGLHVIVPLKAKDEWANVKRFAASVAEEMVEAAPEAYVATMSKAKRTGRIFIDYFRNDYTATSIADYSVRARPGAPVSVPLEWKELKNLKAPNQFTMDDVLKRVGAGHTDAFSKLKAQAIP